MRRCNHCELDKEIDKFIHGKCRDCYNQYQKEYRLKNLEKDSESKKRYYNKNKKKYREYEIKWRKENPEKTKEYGLKNKHGISLEEYKNMLIKQNNKCFICHKKINLYVDHCHKTNKIRGLLCNSCNKALGLFYDSTESLKRAIKYLEEK